MSEPASVNQHNFIITSYLQTSPPRTLSRLLAFRLHTLKHNRKMTCCSHLLFSHSQYNCARSYISLVQVEVEVLERVGRDITRDRDRAERRRDTKAKDERIALCAIHCDLRPYLTGRDITGDGG